METRSPQSGFEAPSADSAIRTFLIADLRGYTRFVDERGDEAAARLTERFAAVASEVVAARAGQVIEVRGDEVLAVFGSAREGIRAAVDLQAAVRSGRDPDVSLEAGIGLDAGEAVPVGDGYRGRALNMAARLCARAEPGEILITPELAHLAGVVTGVAFEDKGPVHLKGFSRPVHMHAVVPATAAAGGGPAGALEIRTLGTFAVSRDGQPVELTARRERLILAHLLLAANHVVSVDTLTAHMWAADPPKGARTTVLRHVEGLRSRLGSERIESTGSGFALRVETDEVDLLRFERLLRRAHRVSGTDPAQAASSFEQALELWRGPPFAELADDAGLHGDVSRLDELRIAAIETLIEARLALGEHDQVVPELQRLVEAHPLRERLWADLMLALYRSGRRVEAGEAFERATAAAGGPSFQLRELHSRILAQDPELDLRGLPLRSYRLMEPIGEGSLGVVWRALDPGVGREVAIKQVRPAFARNEEFVRRFEQEARVVASLEHPHIVPVYDWWRDAAGAHLVMRLMRGGSLADRLGAGPLSAGEAVSVASDVAAALGAAHRRGLVHRDVSPGNVLLDDDGNAYLSDFGLALSGTPPSATETSAGFRSPEQLAGQPVTPKSDVYSLGVLIREMVNGSGDQRATALEPVIARATADDPAKRFADAEEIATALLAVVDGTPAAPPSSEPERNPYKGLRPFGELDAEDFFGRDALVRELIAALNSRSPGHRFLAVVGPSGSGKSSAVRAGLIPALRAGAVPGSERWIYTDMLPGSRPMEELEAGLVRVAFDPMPWLIDELDRDESGLARAVERVLPPGDAELVLLIDQFEELFTLVDDEEARARFVDSLVAAVADPHSRIRVIATLRADFYDRPLLLPGLAEHVRAQTQTVLPLSAEELESAISGPAERVGVVAERVLVAEMIGDVLGQPGGLPLLQYALTETFEACRGGALTLEGYRATGGVTGALAKRAEQLYAELDAPAKDAARQLFLRLVSVGQGSEDTRRLVPLAELASLPIDSSAIDSVIDRFGSHRMLSFDRDPDSRGPTVEVAHEALLREWGRLRGWIDGAREDVIMRRRLEAEAGEWEHAGRDPSFLLRGSRLGQFETWAAASGLALSADERDYLRESIDAREAEVAEEQQRQAKERALERRSIRRLRALVAAMATAAVVAVSLSALALSQRSRAEERGRLATARELATASQANLEVDPQRSLLLALAAARATHQDGDVIPEAITALHSAVSADRTLRTFDGPLWASPDGRILGSLRPRSDGGDVIMLDAGLLQPLATLHVPSLVDAQFSPDSRRFMVVTETGALLFWDTGSWKALPSIKLHRHVSLGGSAWSPDLRTVSVVGDDGIVSVVDTRSGREVQRISHADDGVGYLYTAFSRDGTRVAATVNFGGDYMPIWDVRSGSEVVRVGVNGASYGLAFSPDGSRVATTGAAGRADVWNADTGLHLLSLLGHTGNVWYVAYSPDGQRIGTAGSDGTVRIWDANDGRQLMVLHGHAGDVYGVHFSPSGRQVQTYGADHTGRVWDISPIGSHELLTLDGGGGVEAVEFSGDGRRLLSDQYDGSVRIWDAASGEESLAAGSGGDGVAFSPDARQYVTGGTPAIWDAGTGRHVRDLTMPVSDSIWMSNVAYSSDGSLVAGALGNTTPQSGTVALWDAQSGRRIGTLGQPGGAYDAVRRVVFSPDDTLVAGVTEAGRLHVWKRAGGREILSRDVVNGGGNGVAFGPDGSVVAASGSTGVSLWRTEDGALAARLPGAANVQSVQFSPDGTLLATGGQDEIVRIWDVESNRTILTLAGHTATINSVAFSPDGTRVASGGDDGTVRLYSLDTDQLIGLAEARVTRDFTAAECRQYLHEDRCPASGDRPLNHQHELWTQSAADDPAPEGAYRVMLDRSDFPAGFDGVEDQIGVYTLSLETGSWRLVQVKPSGETWERSGTYRVDAGRRLLLADRNDTDCFGTVLSATWSQRGMSLSFGNVRTTVTPTCGRRGLIVARGMLASHPWSAVVV